MEYKVINTQIAPTGRLEVLSKTEATKLLNRGHGSLHQLYRDCSLAVLNTGNELDDAKELLERYSSFDIRIIQRPRGKAGHHQCPGDGFCRQQDDRRRAGAPVLRAARRDLRA